MNNIRVLRTSETAKLPTRSHPTDHCYDFYADEDIKLYPGQTSLVDLGVRLILPEGYALILKERSGLALNGVIVGAGVIDQGYRGQLKVVLRYLCEYDDQKYPIKISRGDKVVQGKLEKTIDCSIQELSVEEFDTNTDRGENGFNSTGNQQ